MKVFGPLIVVLLAAILLALTNPTTDDFHNYLKVKVSQSVGKPSSQDALDGAFNTLATWFTTEYGMQTAQRNDYIVASVFTANVNGSTHRWIGVLKQFVQVQ